MAKSNIRAASGGRTTLVGPTFFTERVRNLLDGEGARVYREAFRLRSDGQIQTRIIRTWPVASSANECPDCSSTNVSQPDGENMVDCLACGAAWIPGVAGAGRPTEHSSAFRNIGRKIAGRTSADLKASLERSGYTIVEESWRR